MNHNDFVGHEPCPKCGSKDNLARYSDGHAFCFGCGHMENGIAKGSVKPAEGTIRHTLGLPVQVETRPGLATQIPDTPKGRVWLPRDAKKELPSHCLNWLGSYGITREEIIANDMQYSEYWNQLIFPLYEDEILIGYQGRNFDKHYPKYYNSGDFKDVLHVLGLTPGEDRGILLVEDMVSAIKCSRHIPTMPLFGSRIASDTLMRLKRLTNTLLFWLDPDKTKDQLVFADIARSFGIKVKVITTNKDPKDFLDADIKHQIVL